MNTMQRYSDNIRSRIACCVLLFKLSNNDDRQTYDVVDLVVCVALVILEFTVDGVEGGHRLVVLRC